jgi:WD40 repeat protein
LTLRLAAFLMALLGAAAYLCGDCHRGTPAPARATLVGNGGTIKSVEFRSDGAMLSAVGVDGSIMLWDLATRLGRPFPPVGPGQVHAVAFSPAGGTLATGRPAAVVALHDLTASEPYLLLDEPAATQGAACLAFAPDGATLAVGQRDGRITLWDLTTRRARSVLGEHADFVASLAFAPDGATLASSGGDRTVRLWDLAAGRERFARGGQASQRFALAFAPDGRLLALGDKVDRVVRLWDVATGRELIALRGPEAAVVAVAISPDGTTLAAADLHGRITSWDLATWKVRPIRLEHPGVHALAFAPDGRTLASGGFDGTVRLWDWPPPDKNAIVIPSSP